jgi:carbonic anhydrase
LVDNYRYAAELHLVHYNKKYTNVSEALNYVDGILVVGIFFEKSVQNGEFNKFLKFTQYVTQPGSSFSVTNQTEIFNIKDLIQNPVLKYYGYKGNKTLFLKHVTNPIVWEFVA